MQDEEDFLRISSSPMSKLHLLPLRISSVFRLLLFTVLKALLPMLFSRIIFSRAESSVRLLCIILPEGLVLLRSLQALLFK